MSDLIFDSGALTAAAGTARAAAGHVPTHAVAVDAGGCGSAAVEAAAERFSTWARMTALTSTSQLTGIGTDLDTATTLYEQADADIAASAG